MDYQEPIIEIIESGRKDIACNLNGSLEGDDESGSIKDLLGSW